MSNINSYVQKLPTVFFWLAILHRICCINYKLRSVSPCRLPCWYCYVYIDKLRISCGDAWQIVYVSSSPKFYPFLRKVSNSFIEEYLTKLVVASRVDVKASYCLLSRVVLLSIEIILAYVQYWVFLNSNCSIVCYCWCSVVWVYPLTLSCYVINTWLLCYRY